MYRPTEMKEKEEKAPQINSKPKRVLSDLQLEKLKLAREKALAVKQQMKQNSDAQKIQHYEGKIGKIKARQKEEELPLEEMTVDLSNCELESVEPPLEQPVEEEEPQEPKVVVRKSKPKKKPVVIVEESDSDSRRGRKDRQKGAAARRAFAHAVALPRVHHARGRAKWKLSSCLIDGIL